MAKPRRVLRAADVIRMLDLAPLPVEGGYFRVTYEGAQQAREGVAAAETVGGRPIKSVIYYFLTAESRSRLHRLATDEMWHFYLGDPVELYLFGAGDDYTKFMLGHGISQGQTVQAVVPAQSWFGARLRAGGEWALMACSLAPAYRDEDFSMPDAAEFDALMARFPSQREILMDLR